MKKILLIFFTLMNIATIATVNITVNNTVGEPLQVKINKNAWATIISPGQSATYTAAQIKKIKFRRVFKVFYSNGQQGEKTEKIDYTLPDTRPTNFWVCNNIIKNEAPTHNQLQKFQAEAQKKYLDRGYMYVIHENA